MYLTPKSPSGSDFGRCILFCRVCEEEINSSRTWSRSEEMADQCLEFAWTPQEVGTVLPPSNLSLTAAISVSLCLRH